MTTLVSLPLPGVRSWISTRHYSQQNTVLADVNVITTDDGSSVLTFDAPPSDGEAHPAAPVVIPAGVSPAQFQQLVDATEDVATREVSYTANQGGAVWSMVGKVRTP